MSNNIRTNKKRRFHRNREARWLADKNCWAVTIGKNFTERGTLADKDWYFSGHLRKEEADKLANEKAQQWEVICKNWHRTDQPLMEAFGEPLPNEPRWNSHLTGDGRRILDPGAVKRLRGEEDVAEDVINEAMRDYTMRGFIDFFEQQRQEDVEEGFRGTSLAKRVGQMHRAVAFFPDDVPARELVAAHFKDAKVAMKKAKLARRYRSNLLSAALELLEFIYEKYMGGIGLPAGLRKAVRIKHAMRSKVQTYDFDELKAFLKATKGMLSQLDIMLGLNCGMYPQDIGRLLTTEVDLKDHSAFWDREKEPDNDFRLHHLFWPETLLLVKRWLNDGKNLGPPGLDYRNGKNNPVLMDPRQLAFLDAGRPRYWVTPSGSEKNKVSDRLRKIVRGVRFIPLRKTTNNLMLDQIEASDSADRAHAAQELSDRFLGHGTDSLILTYRQFGRGAYISMNRYLSKVGDVLRAEGVFEHVV